MTITDFIGTAADYMLYISGTIILLGSIYLSFKTRFVQVRFLPRLVNMLLRSWRRSDDESSNYTILPHKALLTAMSTTIGLGTIVAPVIAIHLGGPGALLGFVLTAFFGSAATYVEVCLSVQHRKKLPSGAIMGGPMQYLSVLLSPAAAKWYALLCFILMTVWSAAQANQLSAILDSPLIAGEYRIPKVISGGVVAAFVLFFLMGGIKRIGALSAKLVPLMFVVYLGSTMWILGSNLDKLGGIFIEIFETAFYPYQMVSGALVGGILSAMRWGVFKGIHATEAGVGTQSIPHSMAETNDPEAQGTVAMLSTYSAGFISFISGCVALVTRTWDNPDLPMGISMVAASFQMYFASFGIIILELAALLFAFGTILGNAYNGGQCFDFLTERRGTRYYFIATVVMVFAGALSDVRTFWALMDPILACIAILHMVGLVKSTVKKPETVTAQV